MAPNASAPYLYTGAGYRIHASERQLGLEEVKKLIEKLGLDTKSDKIVIKGSNKRANEMGNDAADKSTITRYECFWKQLLDFCIVLGDYHSAIILARDLCPADPWAVKVETAISFLHFRVLDKGSTLLHPATRLPVLNKYNQELLCLGDWKSESGVVLYKSSLTKLHSHYKTTQGRYQEVCPACRAVGLEDALWNKTCSQHINQGCHYSRRGSPTEDETFKVKHKQIVKHVKEANNQRATYALLPHQMRDILDFCIAHNSLYWFMIWTIMLVGTKGFLRIEEDLDVEVERFQTDYFVVKENSIPALAMWVYGKSDQEKITLVLWDDLECPEFAPTRVIFLWLKLSGIKSGKLFPPKAFLQQGTATNSSESIAYDDVISEIKFLVHHVLKVDPEKIKEKHIVGTHILKKTAHLFAFWGFNREYGDQMNATQSMTSLDEADVQQSARHSKKSRQTSTYLADAGVLFKLCKELYPNDPRHKVGRFHSIRIETHHQYDALNMASKPYARPLLQLADWYVHDLLGISREIFPTMSIAQLWRKAVGHHPDLSCETDYIKDLRQHLPPPVAKRIIDNIRKSQEARLLTERARFEEVYLMAQPGPPSSLRRSVGGTPATTITVTRDTESPITDSSPPATNQRRRAVPPEEAIVGKRDYQNLAGAAGKRQQRKELVDICCEAIADIVEQKQNGKLLVDPLKSWANRASRILQCIEQCHGGSKDAFLQENPKFTISKFTTCSNQVNHRAHIP